MALLEELGDKLAKDALKVAAEQGNEDVVDEVGKALGATSTTLQEAFLTSVRFRRAAARGRDVIKEYERTGGKAATAAAAPAPIAADTDE